MAGNVARVGLLAVAVLVAAGAGATLWWWRTRPVPPIVWQGYAEADYVKVGPILPGQLTSLSVARGDEVALGAPLFAQNDTDERAARDQAAQQLEQAKQTLANLENGGKLTEIQQAEDNLADARATLVRTGVDLARSVALLRDGFATKQSVDLLSADEKSAQAKVAGGEAALAQMRAPLGRVAEINAQDAAVRAARASLGMADWRLAQRSVAAPVAGRVADVLAQPGETMASGAAVVSLLPPANIFVRFFVPEPALSSVHRGDAVNLACDGCSAGLHATISFISPQVEYTPPVIYSESIRAKLVYLVEARPPPEQAAQLNPGEPIEVLPAAAHGAP
jgi:HlyD family secretion protein